MRHHWPIWKTALAAIAPMVLVIAWHFNDLTSTSVTLSVLGWLAAGVFYTQLFEYWAHRVPMHRGLPLLRNIRRNHLEHHSLFYGDSFKTRDSENLEHIPGKFWVFPALFALHYGVLALCLPPAPVAAFMLGTVLHYLAFEWSHWFTHIEDNAVDRVLLSLPVVGSLRAYQIEHHREHHEIPELAFNFNPPYLGDRLTNCMPNAPQPVTVPVPSFTPAPVLASLDLPDEVGSRLARWKRPLAYGSAAAVGAALLGAAIVAHGAWSQSRRSSPA